MLGEVLNVFLGQCGAQMSHAFWELFCIEHGIDPDGSSISADSHQNRGLESGRHVFFEETKKDGFTPRTVILDTEPIVIDEIRSGVFKNLFNPQRLLSGNEDAAGNYARGFYHLGGKHAEKFGRALRRTTEACEMLDTIGLFHSYGGGTGSGLMTALFDVIDSEYPKATKLDFAVFPDYNRSLSVLEPYNTVLAASCPFKPECLTVLLQNRAVIDICNRELNINNAAYSHINRIFAQVYSGITAGTRFPASLTSSLRELQTNLIPFPSLSYLMSSFCPFVSANVYKTTKLTADVLLKEALSDRFLLALSPSPMDESVMLSCALLYRGDVSPAAINTALDDWKKSGKLKFTDWSPCGFKIGCCLQPGAVVRATGMASTPLSNTTLYNGTQIKSTLDSVSNDFSVMKNKKAFYHWYLNEGMEETEFEEALNNFNSIMQDYELIDDTAKGVPPKVHCNRNVSAGHKSVGQTIPGLEAVKSQKTYSTICTRKVNKECSQNLKDMKRTRSGLSSTATCSPKEFKQKANEPLKKKSKVTPAILLTQANPPDEPDLNNAIQCILRKIKDQHGCENAKVYFYELKNFEPPSHHSRRKAHERIPMGNGINNQVFGRQL